MTLPLISSYTAEENASNRYVVAARRLFLEYAATMNGRIILLTNQP